MAILSNKGRVIQSLDNLPSPSGGDLLVVQDVANNQTKNITFSQLATTVTALVQTNAVNFTDPTNRFTGSFKGGFAKLDGWLTALNNQFSVKGTAFAATGFNTVQLGSTGQITLAAGSNVLVSSPLTVSGLITAQSGVTGNVIGNVTGNVNGSVVGNVIGNVAGNITGDIYSPTSVLILDNGSGLAKTAHFYGSSSYALSSSHADIANVTRTCETHTTLADYATLGRSASYASQSRSSSYLRYTGAINGTASYAVKTGYATTALHAITVDTALSANTASFLLYSGKFNGSASYARSSSVARSASYSFSGSYARRATSASHALVANGLAGGACIILSHYSIIDHAPISGNASGGTDTGLSITVTPKSANSVFWITANLVLGNGTGTATAAGQLYKDAAPLINRFCAVDCNPSDATSNSVTYFDPAGNISPRTYKIRAIGYPDDGSSKYYVNRAQIEDGNGTPLFFATSSMAILELSS